VNGTHLGEGSMGLAWKKNKLNVIRRHSAYQWNGVLIGIR